MKTTLRDIAEYSGFNVSTVSRALNDDKRISDDTKEKILNVAKKLHYFGEKNKIILFLIANPISSVRNDDFFSKVLEGILSCTKNFGYHCVVRTIEKNDNSLGKIFIENISGIIIGGIPMPKNIINLIATSEIPVVQIGHYKGLEHIPSVSNDNFRGGYIAAKKIVERNYKKILVFSGPLNVETFKERFSGVKKYLEEIDRIKDLEIIECQSFDWNDGYEEAKKIVSSINQKTAIFCLTDWLAKGVIKALKEEKFEIPQDIGLMGFGNLPFSEHIDPSLTTVTLNPYLLGVFSITVVNEIINKSNNVNTEKILVEPGIIERKSI